NHLVHKTEGENNVKIQCPCGLVSAKTHITGGQSGAVSFESVPSFALKLDQFVNTAAYGPVELDIGYGGAFYGILDAATIGLDVQTSSLQDLIAAAEVLSIAINKEIDITHPDEEDLGYLYGIIFTDGKSGKDHDPSANVCIFADGQVDRSPTGSGVTARLAIMSAKGETGIGVAHQIESITGAVFNGEISSDTSVGPYKAVTVRVGGRAHYSGTAEFTAEDDDMLAGGFLLK
ncbi:MAG: proline racemase family protein, partial [Sneathiellales bacterium]|nr:proline racemase family protein [Sneathiellales bacterium]